MALVSTQETISFFDDQHKAGGIRYGDFKKQLAIDMETFIAPLREKINAMLENEKLLDEIATYGAEKARKNAQETMRQVREIIGFSNKF